MTRFQFLLYITFLLVFNCNSSKTEDNFDALAFQKLETYYLKHIKASYISLDRLATSQNKDSIIKHYFNAKNNFKHIEPALAYADVNNYKTISGPNLPIIEEEDKTNIRITQPKNFQVIEENLFIEEYDLEQIMLSAKFLSNRLKFIEKNTSFRYLNKESFLKILRRQIVRTGTTGIGGFDSPAQFSIKEAKIVYQALKNYIEFFKSHFADQKVYEDWQLEFDKTIKALNNPSFEEFDRYNFIKTHTHNQMQLWVNTVKDWEGKLSQYLPLNNDANNLFSDKSFNKLSFLERKISDSNQVRHITSLGNKLFNDNKLGQKGNLSCASCHHSELYFTDGLAKSKDNTGKELLRNSPTLFYALLQRDFFHDSRVGGLEGQVQDVINNPVEFGLNVTQFVTNIKNNKTYKTLFYKAFNDSISKRNVKTAIAYYVASLTPFNSKFDKNMRGDENTLTQSEINGFNIFMGKAACATCHFAPLFNGTVPPDYKHTELEVLGVPKSADWANAKVDSDLGRYYFFNTEERKHAFKTPTIRNVEKTAPYMHNGVYNTLEEVVRFYNVGGGHGIGIKLENQTLPPDSLNLTNREQKDLINFMKTLTEETY